MDCTSFNTAAEILEAFRSCQNPGEQIELFECLTVRPDPPLEAFVELLKGVKLEPILVLTIQALGKIQNVNLQEQLNNSTDLLELLSQKAQSGTTDLIRWAAASTITNIGFDFSTVCQYLPEEPQSIANKIVQSKNRRLLDANLINSNDFESFIQFWVYGPLDELKQSTLDVKFSYWAKPSEGKDFNVLNVCQHIMKNLSLQGLYKALLIDENEVFEGTAQSISDVYRNISSTDIDISIEIQIYCLQSKNPEIRRSAALKLLSLAGVVDFWKRNNPNLAVVLHILSDRINITSCAYSKLKYIDKNCQAFLLFFTRKPARSDAQMLIQDVKNEIQRRLDAFKNRKEKALTLKFRVEDVTNQINALNLPFHEDRCLPVEAFPALNFDEQNDTYDGLLRTYEINLVDPLKKFYDDFSTSYQSRIQTLRGKVRLLESEKTQLSRDLEVEIPGCATFIVWSLLSCFMANMTRVVLETMPGVGDTIRLTAAGIFGFVLPTLIVYSVINRHKPGIKAKLKQVEKEHEEASHTAKEMEDDREKVARLINSITRS